MRSVLVVTTENDIAHKIRYSLGEDYRVDRADSPDTGSAILRKTHYDILFVDLKLFQNSAHRNDYREEFQLFKVLRPSLEIVAMSPREQIRESVKAVKSGACDYLAYPFDSDEVRLVVESVAETVIKLSELNYLRDQFWRSDALEIVHTQNEAMKQVYSKIRSVAPTKTAVLLIGETGTGKSLLAKLLHRHSNRANAQFISVHCGAIPDTLLESELFGHEKGAFTGAVRKRLGKFEIASGGTIFLDEIGTLTPSAQIKLLQVLQDGTFSRVGGEVTLQTDARVIAATNSDLKEMSGDGRFRKDLYYRLNVFPIEIPSLRERIEDLFFLIEIFFQKLNKEFQKDIRGVHPIVLEALKKYSWPGNIRELENLIERAYILETTNTLHPESFPRELFGNECAPGGAAVNSTSTLAEARRTAIENLEKQYLQELLSRNKGKMNKSAEEAGISTRQLHKLLIKYDIRKEEFKI